MDYIIDVLDAADIDRLEPLWLELLDHHLRDAPQLAALGPGGLAQVMMSSVR
jgi:hypothetical protein